MKKKSIVTLLSKILVLVLLCGMFLTLFFLTSCKKNETVDLELPEAITAADVN